MGIILPQTIKVKWHSKNRDHYEEKGYKFTNYKDEFDINVLDLPVTSNKKIKCICDYCNKEFMGRFAVVNPNKQYTYKSELNICCDIKCQNKKTQDILMEKYNVSNVSQIKEVKEKIQQTNIKKYGSTSYLHTDDYKRKSKDTMLERYGVEHVYESDTIRKKINQTMVERYGSKCSLNDPIMRRDAIIKTRKTLYENNNAPCSRQQKYIFDLLSNIYDCKLNHPIDNCSLDIAIPKEKIYIEYDCGGHNKSVKCGWETQDNFKKYESKRQYYIKNKGWKIIRIISDKDALPTDEEIIHWINAGMKYLLSNNHTWYKINIDNHTIESKEYTEKINFKNLRKI